MVQLDASVLSGESPVNGRSGLVPTRDLCQLIGGLTKGPTYLTSMDSRTSPWTCSIVRTSVIWGPSFGLVEDPPVTWNRGRPTASSGSSRIRLRIWPAFIRWLVLATRIQAQPAARSSWPGWCASTLKTTNLFLRYSTVSERKPGSAPALSRRRTANRSSVLLPISAPTT